MNFRFYLIILLMIFLGCAQAAPKSNRGLDGFEFNNAIDAAKNARGHAAMGNLYFDEKNYNAALKEYQIAYALVADSSAGASYLYNMARCMIAFGDYSAAKNATLAAIKKDCINMTYYQTLADCYIALGEASGELNRLLYDYTNPYNRIIAGLIYLKTNQKLSAKIIFDEFINDNPDMIITDDVRQIMREM